MRKIIYGILCLVSMFCVVKVSATCSYSNSYNAVDGGGNIHYDGNSNYNAVFNYALGKWNDRGHVNIAEDTIFTEQDLEYYDDWAVNEPWGGAYAWVNPGIDYIIINTWKFAYLTTDERQMVMLHEWGHALSLAHSTTGNVMFRYITDQDTLGSQDISTYNCLWS